MRIETLKPAFKDYVGGRVKDPTGQPFTTAKNSAKFTVKIATTLRLQKAGSFPHTAQVSAKSLAANVTV